MATILEKIQTALDEGRSLKFKVARQTAALYCGVRRGSPYYTLVWYEGSERRRKSSRDKDEIITATSIIMGSLSQGTLASASLLDEPEEVAKIPIKELLDFYKKHHPDFREVFNSPTTTQVTEELLAATEKSGKSYRHVKNLRHHLRAFCKRVPGKIRKISVENIGDYLYQIPHLKTRLNHRISIISLFRFAQRRGYLPEKETTAAEKTDRPSVRPVEPEIFTPQELAAMLSACTNPKLKAYLVFGGLCGLRSAETARLRWENVREDHIILGANITKTARRRVAEIPGNAQAWLSDIREPQGPVGYSCQNHLYAELKKLCGPLKISWKQNALRHSFASYHLEFHRDPPRTSKTAGHSLRMLETTYAKLVSREDAVAWFSVFPSPQKEYEQKTPRQNIG